jgi:hypothetical protein
VIPNLFILFLSLKNNLCVDADYRCACPIAGKLVAEVLDFDAERFLPECKPVAVSQSLWDFIRTNKKSLSEKAASPALFFCFFGAPPFC